MLPECRSEIGRWGFRLSLHDAPPRAQPPDDAVAHAVRGGVRAMGAQLRRPGWRRVCVAHRTLRPVVGSRLVGLLGGRGGEGLRNVPPDGRTGSHLYRPMPYWMTVLDSSHWSPRVSPRSLPGFFAGWGRSTPHIALDRRWTFEVPHWFALLLTAALPAVRLAGLFRARRHARVGLCPICGYDLRATPDKCPECGEVPQKATV